MKDITNFLTGQDEDGTQPTEVTTGNEITAKRIYTGNGSEDINFCYSDMPGAKKYNLCHDDISYATVTIFPGHTLPSFAGFTRELAKNEYYFQADIRTALQNPWQGGKCVYYGSRDEYTGVTFTGVFNFDTSEYTPLYTTDPQCPNSGTVTANGSSVTIAYHCLRNHQFTDQTYAFDLPMQ